MMSSYLMSGKPSDCTEDLRNGARANTRNKHCEC